jgi:DNA-binding NarL/FixJ family response regulator
MDRISLVIVDDHPLFRQGVVDLFSAEPDIELVGEAESGQKALDIIRSVKPNVAILDVNLPEINGQQITRQIKQEKLPTRVVLLTAYDDTEQVIHAMRSGASAYCAKDVMPETLVDVVRAVTKGQFYIIDQAYDQDGLTGWLAEQTEKAARPYSDPGDPFHPLSNREMEVLECVTHGKSNKEIAQDLDISHQTVKNHVTAILRKLGVEDRTQAAVYALRRGWVRLYDQATDDQETAE